MLHQPLTDLLAEEELKELGFGDVRGQFDVIEATLANLLITHGWLFSKTTRSMGQLLLEGRGFFNYGDAHNLRSTAFALGGGRPPEHRRVQQLPLPAHVPARARPQRDDSQG